VIKKKKGGGAGKTGEHDDNHCDGYSVRGEGRGGKRGEEGKKVKRQLPSASGVEPGFYFN